jgi:hypothetical protein
MKKVVLWMVGIVVVLFIIGNLLPDDSNEKAAAINAIKQTYAPSGMLLLWNPNFSEAQWAAVPCGEKIGGYDDCYHVFVWVDVIPNGEKKTVKAEWLVYDQNTKNQADNAEARTFFVSH